MPLKSFSSSWITCRSENQYKTLVAQLHQDLKLSIQNMESSCVHDWKKMKIGRESMSAIRKKGPKYNNTPLCD
jgi:hypothetical protein